MLGPLGEKLTLGAPCLIRTTILAALVTLLALAWGCKKDDRDDHCLFPPKLPLTQTGSFDLTGPPPDILILSVGGHARSASALTCSEDKNRSYLGNSGNAVDALTTFFFNEGLEVAVRNFSDRLQASDQNFDGIPDDLNELGFLELLLILDQAYLLWILDQASPTRIVLVCHSHGGNWAHLATAIRPEIPIEYLISLDNVVTNWECEHRCQVASWVHFNGLAFELDISQPESAIFVPGQNELEHVKDVVFDNVRYNVEVQSTGPPPLNDCCDNYRRDGFRDGIFTDNRGETHAKVYRAGSESMDWVLGILFLLENPE